MVKKHTNINRLLLVGIFFFSLACNLLARAPLQTVAPQTPTAAASASRLPVQPSDLPATDTPIVLPTPTGAVSPLAYIPPVCQNKPVATLAPSITLAQPTPGPKNNPPISQTEQLKVFEALASTITQVYLYPDFNGLDWTATVKQYRAKIESGMDTETFYAEMRNLVAALGDEHSAFQSPAVVAESKAELSGVNNYVGLGLLGLPMPQKNRISVLEVFPNSTAEHSGLKQHDSILALDGIPVVKDGKAMPQLLRGPPCSAIVLTVQSPGGNPYQITLLRYPVNDPLPMDVRMVPTRDGSNIGYIFLPSFFDETFPAKVKQALADFGNLDGLIIDNRMNNGGSSAVVEPILSHFVAGNLGNFISRASTRPFYLAGDPINNSMTVPLVVLVGPDTVSFGEIFSGILQDQGRAKIVGQSTQGHVESLHGYDFIDGSRAWIAQERFDPAHTHANWEKKGVTPDVVAYADWDTFTFVNDPSLAAALKLLGHK
ncbi:MAG: hypothetical protein IMZ61_14335 [Planctomycetes bacterium]|nr:hypothetical protein [Planctomycetota bacterium]